MNRESVANAVLWPADAALGLVVKGLESAGALEAASGIIMEGARKGLRAMLGAQNALVVEGAENVPLKGGVIFASNHQSWLDVQVLGASSPRRIHFMAKTEFETWPVLRHMVRLSESVFVRRGGDDGMLEQVTDALRKGWAVAIYPEGTIPGEEDIPRSAVEPATGLLRGRSGVARMALAADVPIVPVGVSGSGRAFPPEIYPRLEVLEAPRNKPVRIRFGKPITMDAWRDREPTRELYRELTDRVMHDISALVDHAANYAPIEVPVPPLPRFEKLGVLLLHGFTSHTATVSGLLPHLEAAGIDYEMPVLRGHGTHFRDLEGVTARDWYVDAERALLKLHERVDRVVVVGLSMGGLVSLELGMRHPDKVAGLVTVAAALRFKDPAAFLTPLISKVVRFWPSPESFNDLSLKVNCKNYPKFATDAFASLYAYAQHIEERLPELHVPIRILQSRRDQVIAPVSANVIYERVASFQREIGWFEKSGHEMMQDLEADAVFEDIMTYVGRFLEQRRAVLGSKSVEKAESAA